MMLEDIQDQAIDDMKSTGLFFLKMDDSTDGVSCVQLTAFVHYVHNDVFKDEFLC